MIRPGLSDVRRTRRDPLDGAFRDVTGDRGEAIEPSLANPVGERIDETRDIRRRRVGQRRAHLLQRQLLGECRRQAHDFDTEARIDGFDPIAEQPRQPLAVANRPCGADANGLDAIVDAMEEEIEATRTLSATAACAAIPDAASRSTIPLSMMSSPPWR